MATNIINVANASLPRSLDVSVIVSKPQIEQTTDLSVPVFVQSSGGMDFGAGRIAYFSTYDSVAADSRVSAAGLAAARDFFAQPTRPAQFAIAQAFAAAQTGYMKTGAVGAVSAFNAVTAGSFAIAIDGVNANIQALNFSTDTTLAQIASRLQTAIRAVATGGFTLATVTVQGTQLKISSGTTGNSSQVSVLSPVSPAVGTDISGPTLLNGRSGTAVSQVGYLPTGLLGELDLIYQAAQASGKFVYGWALDASYRDTSAQIDAAGWAQAHKVVMPLVSNSPLAWDPASTTDLGPVVKAAGQYRVWPIYHDNAAYYPDVAELAVMLSVDYRAKDSTITAKFKDFVGIPVVGITVSQWNTLNSKGYNTFTLTGNNARVFRDGDTGNASWFADDVVNLDNFSEELQVEVFNVFLRNGKVPYTAEGVALLRDGIERVCTRYVYNGTFAPREMLDKTKVSGTRIDPAYAITFTPIAQMTASDRAQRIGPPARIDANLAGAIHSIAINVNAYS